MGLFFAWAIGEGFIVWRWAKAKAPPPPGALLLASGLFLGLAVIAEYQPARTAATAFAYAVDLAVALQLIGKDPAPQTGWPPPLIDNPDVILPAFSAARPAASTATGTSTGKSKGVLGDIEGLTIIPEIKKLLGKA